MQISNFRKNDRNVALSHLRLFALHPYAVTDFEHAVHLVFVHFSWQQKLHFIILVANILQETTVRAKHVICHL